MKLLFQGPTAAPIMDHAENIPVAAGKKWDEMCNYFALDWFNLTLPKSLLGLFGTILGSKEMQTL